MERGRLANGIRKVKFVDNLGRDGVVHISGEGSLAEAFGDLGKSIQQMLKMDGSATQVAYWQHVHTLTLYCGDEQAVITRRAL